MGITVSAVANYENEISSPKAELLYLLMGALKYDVTCLYQDETKVLGGYPVNLEYEEHEHVKKYRLLDPYGKEAVDCVLDIESRRCAAAREEPLEPEKITCFRAPEYAIPMRAGSGEESECPQDRELTKAPPRGISYVARLHGDSMEPDFHDGDTVFVHACKEIPVSRIGAFFIDGQQWTKELSEGVLLSHNPIYPPQPVTGDICCQGLILDICDESYFE